MLYWADLTEAMKFFLCVGGENGYYYNSWYIKEHLNSPRRSNAIYIPFVFIAGYKNDPLEECEIYYPNLR